MNNIRLPVIAALILLLLIPSCMGKKEADPKGSTENKSNNVAEVLSVTKREDKAPNFSWGTAAGEKTDLDSYMGKATLVNFWATWCGPCKMELPDLIAISREMAPRGVKIIGVSTDRGSNARDEVGVFIAEKGIPFPIVLSNDELDEAFGNVRLIPTTFLLDADGRIVQKIVGMRSKEDFLQAINAVLEGEPVNP